MRTFDNIPLATLVDYIDWSPFFSAWRLRGSYPQILQDEKQGEEATKLFNDAQRFLKEMIASNDLKNKAKVGFFKASSLGDDIELQDEKGKKVETLCMLRSQRKMENATSHNRSLADFVAPLESNKEDYIGAFVVTAGLGLEKLIAKYEKDHDDYAVIMLKSLADRLAEAFAEFMHEKVRKELWGYAAEENLSNDELIKESYRGIRPAPGYPACPDHSEKKKLFKLLDADEIGVTLTSNCAMWPASSVSGWYFAHPEAKYFNVGKIDKDQVESYAKRNGMTLEEANKWLASLLAY